MRSWCYLRISKSHLKSVVEATLSGMEFVANTYDNRFYRVDILASLRSVPDFISVHSIDGY